MTVLRTGAEVPEGLAPVVMISLELLMNGNPVALYELAQLARDPSHRLFGNTGEVLRSLNLVDAGGKVHDATRAVVLAATDGDGSDLRLRSPYAEGADRA